MEHVHHGAIGLTHRRGSAFADDVVWPENREDRRADAALVGLRRLRSSDLDIYKSFISAAGQMGFSYYFPYLLRRDMEEDCAVFLGEDEGSLCVFLLRHYRSSRPHLDVLLAPAPMNLNVLRRCLERANDHNGNYRAAVMKIDEKDIEQLSDLLRLTKKKEQYLYAPCCYAEIRGNRFRTVRRNVAMAEALLNLEVLPFTSEHTRDCLRLLYRWHKHYRHKKNYAVRSATRVIGLVDTLPDLDLRGEVVFVDGSLSAFSFGGEIRPGLGCYIEAKSDLGIPGLSYFQRLHFLRGMSQFELVNDGSHGGHAGLKQIKDSFRPVMMHIEYRGYQRVEHRHRVYPRLLARALKAGARRLRMQAFAKFWSRQACSPISSFARRRYRPWFSRP